MATFRFLDSAFPNGFDIRAVNFQEIFDYAFDQTAPGFVRFFNNSANYIELRGTGLTYEFWAGELVGVTGGRMTGLTEREFGRDIVTVTGLDISARDFTDHIIAGRDAAALAMMVSGNDRITGTGRADWLAAGSGNDRIDGSAGHDTLLGDAGNDTLAGGSGADMLTGGAGADDFLFLTGPRSGIDTIRDFQRTLDDLVIENAAFAGLGAAGALGGRYVEGRSARDAGDRIIYTQATGEVRFDADGSGAGGAVVIARVTPGTDLSAGDFWVM